MGMNLILFIIFVVIIIISVIDLFTVPARNLNCFNFHCGLKFQMQCLKESMATVRKGEFLHLQITGQSEAKMVVVLRDHLTELTLRPQ